MGYNGIKWVKKVRFFYFSSAGFFGFGVLGLDLLSACVEMVENVFCC